MAPPALPLLLWSLGVPASAYRPSGGEALEAQALGSAKKAAGSVQTLEVLDSAHMRWAGHRAREPGIRSSLAATAHNGTRHADLRARQGAADRRAHVGHGSLDGGNNQTALLPVTSSSDVEQEFPHEADGVKGQPEEERHKGLVHRGHPEAPSDSRPHKVNRSAFALDFLHRDSRALKLHLQQLSPMLQQDPAALGILTNCSYGERLPGQKSQRRLPFFLALAEAGWLQGLRELAGWDSNRSDAGPRLAVDSASDSCEGNETGLRPLGLAVEAGHEQVVRYLVSQGASAVARSPGGPTLLEAAVRRCDGNLAGALLGDGSVLKGGLAQLRKRLALEAAKLPHLNGRWPIGQQKGDGLDGIRALVPQELHPVGAEQEVIGQKPSLWILFYKTRVMCSLASMRPCDSAAANRVARVLAEHGFDSFARDFFVSAVILASILGGFGLFAYVGFRIKLYGPLDAPVSMAEFIPGAFNPSRMLDSDFDPSRQKGKLPYRAVKEYLAPQGSSCTFGMAAFGKALTGIFSSWLLQFVRIPPEKDPYDEDYQSDDDEDTRTAVRDQCRARAACVQKLEVAMRTTLLVQVLFWLSWGAGRWHDAMVCALLCLYHSWFAACAASCAEPAPEPEKVPEESEGNVDAASVVSAIFSVQYGPRWGRAIVSTRSTATAVTLRRTSLLARRRNRKPRQRPQGGPRGCDSDNESGSEAAGSQVWSETEVASFLEASAEDTPYSDRFQRALLQSGLLHVKHRSLLERSVLSMVTIFVLLLWLFHLRWLSKASLFQVYAGRTPAQIFSAYGAPGTWRRFVFLVLELGLLWISADRLYACCSLLNVAGLSLKQRCAALVFAGDHLPPLPSAPSSTSNSEEAAAVRAIRHVDESKRCADFALELSAVRWGLLATPVLVAYFCTVKLLVISLLLLGSHSFRGYVPASWSAALDPAVPLTIALCLSGPLLPVLLAAASANRELACQQRRLESAAEEVLDSSSPGGADCVALRVRVRDAMGTNFIRWPGGRRLDFCETGLIICLLAIIIGVHAIPWITAGPGFIHGAYSSRGEPMEQSRDVWKRSAPT